MKRWSTLIAIVSLSGCLEPIDPPEEGDIPFRVQEAFNRSCAVPGCHDSDTKRSGLSLAPGDSDAIVDGNALGSELPLVAVGDLDGSYMAHKILDYPDISGDQMPPGGGGNVDDLSIIVAWISGLDVSCEPGTSGCPCDGDGMCDGDLVCTPDDVCLPTPQFSRDVWPILEESCALESCHGSDATSAGTTLHLTEADAYANMVDVPYGGRMFIDPGDLSNSHVWQVVTGADGIPMPLGMAPLSGIELQIIRDWILADAPK